ncbi:preprotein translocase subunit SecY [Eubacterium xylanophilum]|uniref:preprotein translocase subunit SecY n=1 Tax=Eubacterium xylanophilum TaxID=39497 RepID=UPI00047C7349|nr:preprotein translocase subunit SecY [Eubacterium xylanophilum]
MLDTIKRAFQTKEIRNKLLFVLLGLVIVRIGCNIPVPGVNSNAIQDLLSSNKALNFLDVMTGGSFTRMSIFALNITPYITSSIIIQLLTIAIPKFEEMQKDGEDGRKKLNEYTRYLSIVLAIIEGVALVIGFRNQNLFTSEGYTPVIIAVVAMTAGAAFLMWLGEQITEKGIGNGISIILLINIVARIPSDLITLYNQFIKGAGNITNAIVAAVIIVGIIVAMFVFIVWLQDGERRIPVQYAKKMQGRKLFGGQSSHIPLKVNTAGVIPVIFASSMLQLPIIIASFAGVQPKSGDGATLLEKFLKVCDQSKWCNVTSFAEFKYTLGLLVYIALVIFFAYFYTSVTFNPLEISNNMKKQGGFIPGIRPGKPTTDYLTTILNSIIFIGAVAMVIVCVLPIIFSGAFGANVSFTGTSLIIIVGVIIETLKQIESQLLVRNYQGFLH